jgi:hypothetical protein
MAIFTSIAFPGAARATTGGPVISEFETGLTSGVGLWGITADGPAPAPRGPHRLGVAHQARPQALGP